MAHSLLTLLFLILRFLGWEAFLPVSLYTASPLHHHLLPPTPEASPLPGWVRCLLTMTPQHLVLPLATDDIVWVAMACELPTLSSAGKEAV